MAPMAAVIKTPTIVTETPIVINDFALLLKLLKKVGPAINPTADANKINPKF